MQWLLARELLSLYAVVNRLLAWELLSLYAVVVG
jgi:hypothetical protein